MTKLRRDNFEIYRAGIKILVNIKMLRCIFRFYLASAFAAQDRTVEISFKTFGMFLPSTAKYFKSAIN